MSRKRKQLPELRDVEITGVAAEGKAVAKVYMREEDDTPLVIFVPYGAPGDIVNLQIDKKKHHYAEAHITEIKKPSALRIEPGCEYFGVCGGCKWRHLPYSEQLAFKRSQVKDAMERIAKIDLPEIPSTLGSDDTDGYRNKMEYTFSAKRWRSWAEIRGEVEAQSDDRALGFHIPGSFDKVLDIRKCLLQDSKGDEIRNFVADLARENDYSFYNIKENHGLLRTLMIRIASNGQIMVCLVFGEDQPDKINQILEAVKVKFPEITTIVYAVNLKVNDSIADQEVLTFSGPGFIEEEMGDLKFRISPKSFYQTNSLQAKKLYEKVAEFAGLDETIHNSDAEKPLVYDLYTGTGTIANFVAHGARKVIGIEYVEDAIKDARINSDINGISNTEFFAGDMKDVLTDEFISLHGRPDIIIVDPPRAGMHEDVVDVILNAEPQVIVYVSCNPATQARDLIALDKKYKVTKIQPVDMFPHTHHVENVVKLELKK